MAIINQTGLAILIAQLENMGDLGCVQNTEPNRWIKGLIAEFRIPDKLIPAFIAYAEEFLQKPNGCINESGPFWDECDILGAIISKFRMFYHPIVLSVYPTFNWVNDQIIIEPSYEDATTICIILNNKCVLLDNIKAWHFWFSPEDLLDNLEEIAAQIRG